MPFKSERQRRYLHAKHPRIAKRWEKEKKGMPKAKKKLSAAGRTYKSMTKGSRKAIKGAMGITGKATRAQRKAIGRSVRKGRLKGGRNPNTGGRVSAKQLGLKGTAKKAYKAATPSQKQNVVKAYAKSGLKKTGRSFNKTINPPTRKASTASTRSGPTKKTRTVSRIAARKGISRSAANKVRKSRKKK